MSRISRRPLKNGRILAGAILFKANQAAVLAWNGGDPGTAPNNTNGKLLWDSSIRVPLPNGNGALVVWQQNGTVGIALQVWCKTRRLART